MNYGIFRVAKLKTMGNLKGSLMHARREQDTPNANPTLTPNNILLTDTATVEAVMKKYEELKPEKIRADQVRALEVLITASPEAMKAMTKEQQIEYLKKGLEFSNKEFGGEENLLHAEIHLDETTPHLTAFYIPLVTSKNARSGKVKTGLNAKKLTGGKKEFSERQTRFYEQVSKGYGLERGEIGSKATHKKVLQWYSELNKEEMANIVSDVFDDLKSKARSSEVVGVDELKSNVLGVFPITKKVERKATFKSPMVSLNDVVKTMSPYMQTGAVSKMREREKQAFKQQARKEVEAEIKEKIKEAEEAREQAYRMEVEATEIRDNSLRDMAFEAYDFYSDLATKLNVDNKKDAYGTVDIEAIKNGISTKIDNLTKVAVRNEALEKFKNDVDYEVSGWTYYGGERVYKNFDEYKKAFNDNTERVKRLREKNEKLEAEVEVLSEQKREFNVLNGLKTRILGLLDGVKDVVGIKADLGLEDMITTLVEFVRDVSKPDKIKEMYDKQCEKLIDENADKIVSSFNVSADNSYSWNTRASNYNSALDMAREMFNYARFTPKEVEEAFYRAKEAVERDEHLASVQRPSVQHPRMRM